MSDPRTDSEHLLHEQYRDGSRLLARQRLHREFSSSRVGWHEWLFARMRLPKGAQILEVGCGRGQLWWDNRESLPAGLSACLTDVSPGMVEETRQRLATVLPGASFEEADAQDLAYEDASFDFVLAHHMLYHLPSRQRALSEFWRILRPGGVLLAATNGPRHMEQLRQLANTAVPEFDSGPSDPEFNLENGPNQLRPWFVNIRVVERRDLLRVTRSEAVLDYLRSLIVGQLSSADVELIEIVVTEAISQEGYFGVETASGLIRGRRRAHAARLAR